MFWVLAPGALARKGAGRLSRNADVNPSAGQIRSPSVSMRGTPHRRKGRGGVSRYLRGQNGVVEKMKANRPRQALVAIVKSAADEITNHGQEFVEAFSLGGHFRLVAGRHQHVVILFDLKYELFLHAGIVPHYVGNGKRGLRCPLYPAIVSGLLFFAGFWVFFCSLDMSDDLA